MHVMKAYKGRKRYTSSHSYSPYDMEVRSLPHVPTALPWGKESPVSMEEGRAFWGRGNVLFLPEI